MKKIYKNLLFFILLILFCIFLYIIYLLGPENIVNYIGVQNTYLFIFIYGLIAGVFFLTATSFYISLGTFVIGGANLYLLAFIASFSLTLGDTLFYFFGKKSRKLSKESNFNKKIEKFTNRIKNKSDTIIFMFIFFYWSFFAFTKGYTLICFRFIKLPFEKNNICNIFLKFCLLYNNMIACY
ncbi:membrane protein YqaA, SNARE-associated domain [Candidatus Vampirococcus lugosii]|uniref:Membrane protein YqaA, SNARE-associated domain n=1 Tax=Candidatus Vampirococcus lugosii TaxID=2789015 RepID=A0ABS5QL58_9BACT|nr:membrane protein YqaA, SNARE-associated domain [Candidatus Vampirococcus lugosii]